MAGREEADAALLVDEPPYVGGPGCSGSSGAIGLERGDHIDIALVEFGEDPGSVGSPDR